MSSPNPATYGLTLLNYIPVREEPRHAAQLVTQLIFGEPYTLLEKNGLGWIYIQSTIDKYKGWIDLKQHRAISTQLYTDLKDQGFLINTSRTTQYTSPNEITRPVGLGAILPKNLEILKKLGYHIDKPTKSAPGTREEFLEFAFKFLDVPYLWGGRSEHGIDCSALVQLVYRSVGIEMPRDSKPQSEFVRKEPLKETLPGDLAFFAEQDKLDHVGLILENNRILHASGRVRIDKLDETGIFIEAEKRYSHRFLHAGTVIH